MKQVYSKENKSKTKTNKKNVFTKEHLLLITWQKIFFELVIHFNVSKI